MSFFEEFEINDSCLLSFKNLIPKRFFSSLRRSVQTFPNHHHRTAQHALSDFRARAFISLVSEFTSMLDNSFFLSLAKQTAAHYLFRELPTQSHYTYVP
jgi:hypothetical protein